MSVIVKLKESFPIQQVAASVCGGLVPSRSSKGSGIYYMGWCPFCQGGGPIPGKKRKFWVDVQKQLCNCFKCGDKAMDVINLYARLNGLDNDTAIADMWAERLVNQ